MSDKELNVIKYSIFKYSSYSTIYVPENILEDKPHDQASRWSSDSSEFPQYLILKLEQPSIVKIITFGKYENNHVCNIKKFCVYGGLTEDNMVLLLESELKNNSCPEIFTLRHTVGNNAFPVKFVKIMPLQCWTSSFNFSIWFVKLQGCSDWNVVRKCINWYAVYREMEAVRLCLKHFRQHNYTEAFESLMKQCHVQLEDPFLTELHTCLVKRGDFEACEKLLERAAYEGYFERYISQVDYEPKWKPIVPFPGQLNKENPGMRGGHQMCIDTSSQTIYLFGGWDGTQDLSDLWSYKITTGEWTCISQDTQADGGPSGRSCHKMCLDTKRGQLFILGKYLDSSLRHQDKLKSDFYMYEIESGTWTLLTKDTSTVGGPKLVFDHQMVMDVEKRVIYIFGGRVLTPSRWEGCMSGLSDASQNHGSNYCPNEPIFSGLYSYYVATSTWTKLRDDSPGSEIKARIGHSMLFHSGTHQLFILGGQRHKEFLTDFFIYNIDDDTITCISDGLCKDSNALPSAGFTQKATIDPYLNEIHVFAGLNKNKVKRDDNVRNSFWVYKINENKWSCIYQNEQMDDSRYNTTKMQQAEPCPRYAHQLVYDEDKKIHYMFGGNPGKQSLPKMRLDDFWSLRLCRPTSEQLLKICLFLIRKNKFKELSYTDKIAALKYLQTTLSCAVDHTNVEQVKEFQNLTSTLFHTPDPLSLFLSTPSLHLSGSFLPADRTCLGNLHYSEVESLCKNSFSLPHKKLSSLLPHSSSISAEIINENIQEEDVNSSTRLTKAQLEALMHQMRSQLFDELSKFFPESMTQPRSNLVDLIPF